MYPQEHKCEGGCTVGKKGEPVAIGNLERLIADFERSRGQLGLPAIAQATDRSVAIVGSGPAGLSAAGDLVQRGHRVRVFEALHELGGVLVYGIPGEHCNGVYSTNEFLTRINLMRPGCF